LDPASGRRCESLMAEPVKLAGSAEWDFNSARSQSHADHDAE
jgi:hypothetical protein